LNCTPIVRQRNSHDWGVFDCKKITKEVFMKKKLLLALFLMVGLAPIFVSGISVKTTSNSNEESPMDEVHLLK
jgi:hypothetical protein